MQLLSKVLPDDHNIFHFGDVHDGSILSSKSGWKVLVDMMHSKYDGCRNNYGIDGGDMIEAITVDDKRFSEEKMVEPLPLEQMEEAVKMREPIKNMLLTILMGNHEDKLWRFGNITEMVCNKLCVPYGTYTAKISIHDKHGNLMYKIWEAHGNKNMVSTADDPQRRRTNQELILKRHLRQKAADCAVMVKHHAHKILVCKPVSDLYLTDDGEKIHQNYTGWGQTERYIHPDARWYGCAGSFLKLYGQGMSGYAEKKEYDPVELGFLILKVRDRKIISLDPYYIKI